MVGLGTLEAFTVNDDFACRLAGLVALNILSYMLDRH